MRVAKFGGSNLKRPGDLLRIVGAMGEYGPGTVAVVSAFSGITDLLLDAAGRALEFPDEAKRIVDSLAETHLEAIRLSCSGKESARAVEELGTRLERLGKLFTGVHFLGGLPDFTHDEILSYGERLSSLVLSAAIRSSGMECSEVFPESMGLISDGIHRNSIADMEACSANLPKAFGKVGVFVVPGFYGMSSSGRVTLFGRGGSDYSAAVIARCLRAESLDLWKDTDGFLTADPRIVKDARRVEILSYAEAAELSYFGAKIMHPRTVEPLRGTGIEVRVLDVRADGSVPKTIIPESSTAAVFKPKGVSFTDDIGILRLSGAGVGMRPGVLARATGKLDDHGINIKSVVTSQTSIDIVLSRSDLEPSRAAVAPLAAKDDFETCLEDGLSIIAAVGEGILGQKGIAARILGAVSAVGVNVEIVSIGASPCAAYFYVRREDRDEAVRAVHGALFHSL